MLGSQSQVGIPETASAHGRAMQLLHGVRPRTPATSPLLSEEPASPALPHGAAGLPS